MRRHSCEMGGARALLVVVLLAVVALALYLVGRTWLSKYEDPVEISGRLETLIGSPVTLAGVETRPLRRQVLLRGFEMAPSTSVELATLDVDPSALLAGEWEFGNVDLYKPIWRMPAQGEDSGPFLKGLLLPLSLATRAEAVTLKEGMLLTPAGAGTLATSIGGKLSRQRLDSPHSPVNAVLEWVLHNGDDVLLEGVYSLSGASDSVSIENLRLTTDDLLLFGRGDGSVEPPVWARVDLASEKFCGGALKINAGYKEASRGPEYDAHVVVTGADGVVVLRDRFGKNLISSGRLDADFKIEGAGPVWGGSGDVSVRGEGDVIIVDVVIDPDGPLAELIPILRQGGGSGIESISGHLDISHDEVLVQDVTARSSGMIWTGSGRVLRDGSLSGVLLGRIPAQAIAVEGTAVAMFAAMLAGRDGRIPAAFSVGGTLENPFIGFDVDGTADAIAASGVPQAKQLIKGLSRQEKEEIARTVDDFLRGRSGN